MKRPRPFGPASIALAALGPPGRPFAYEAGDMSRRHRAERWGRLSEAAVAGLKAAWAESYARFSARHVILDRSFGGPAWPERAAAGRSARLAEPLFADRVDPMRGRLLVRLLTEGLAQLRRRPSPPSEGAPS